MTVHEYRILTATVSGLVRDAENRPAANSQPRFAPEEARTALGRLRGEASELQGADCRSRTPADVQYAAETLERARALLVAHEAATA